MDLPLTDMGVTVRGAGWQALDIRGSVFLICLA